MSDIADIIARLEMATEQDRALDCKIWLALFDKQIMVDGGGYKPNARSPKYESARKIWSDDWPHWNERTQVEHGVALEINAPQYTASIDAALTLVPEGYRTMHAGETKDGKWFWGLHMDAGHSKNPTTKDGISWAHQTDSRPELFADGAPSPAIALCIAALKARAALSMQERNHD